MALYKTIDLKQWMGDLPDYLKSVPINQLLFPGTHNSSSYKVDIEQKFNDTNWAGTFSWVPSVETRVGKWVKNQDLSLYEQLKQGIRKFDFRLAYSQDGDQFYFCHTFALIKVETGLNQIKRFIDKYPTELIYIECKADYANYQTINIDTGNRFLNIVKDKLGSQLVKNVNHNRINSDMTLNKLVESSQNVLFNYFDDHDDDLNFWDIPTRLLTEYTPNLDRKWEIIEEFLNEVNNSDNDSDNDSHWEIALTLTPNTKTVLESIFNPFSPSSVKELSKDLHQQMYRKLKEWDLSKINSFVIDYPDEKYVRWVIKYNLNNR